MNLVRASKSEHIMPSNITNRSLTTHSTVARMGLFSCARLAAYDVVSALSLMRALGRSISKIQITTWAKSQGPVKATG